MTRYAGTADPRLPRAGQGDHEARAAAFLALHHDDPPLGLYQPFGDGQAESGAAACAAARFIDLVKPVEDVRQFGLGDSRPGVRDAEEHMTAAFGGTDDDLAAPRRGFQGGVPQVRQYLNRP